MAIVPQIPAGFVKSVDCLKGCIRTSARGKGLFMPFDEPIMYPWVEAWIPGENFRLSMGNDSSRENEAQIKSFNFGISNGLGAKIEIVDESGGQFYKFFQRLNYTNRATSDKMIRFRWGYIGQTIEGQIKSFKGSSATNPPGGICGASGGSGLPLPDPSNPRLVSAEHTLFIQDIECQASSASCFKFIINALDMHGNAMGTVDNRTFGGEKNPIFLTVAIRELFKPYKIDVDFVEIDSTGNRRPLMFYVPPNTCPTAAQQAQVKSCGPCGRWNVGNRPPLEAASAWMNEVFTNDRRGIIRFWEDTPSGQKLVFARSNRDPTKPFDEQRVLGTYLVNGASCLDTATEVLTEDGWKRIGSIYRSKYSGNVACVNKDKKLLWSPITEWHRNKLNGRQILKISLENSRKSQGKFGGGLLTEDHLVLTDSGWLCAGKLLPASHKIHTGTNKFAGKCEEALIGSLLGDMSIQKGKGCFSVTHCEDQKNYLEYKSKLFDLLRLDGKKKNGINCDGKTRYAYRATGITTMYGRFLRKSFYPEGIKIVSDYALSRFSEISLAYLFMDDGSLWTDKKGKRKPKAQIASCAFSPECVDKLINAIKNLGVNCYTRLKEKYPRIYFTVEETVKLSALIHPYILPEFEYKLHPDFRNKDKINITTEYEPFYDSFSVSLAESRDDYGNVYCLGVAGYENFVSRAGVVHNCSPVISFQPNYKFMYQQAMTGAVRPPGNAEMPNKNVGQKQAGLDANSVTPPVMTNLTNAGLSMQPNTGQRTWIWLLQDAAKYVLEAATHNNYANMVFSPIEAELKIQGNPAYEWPYMCNGYALSIVYLNPFRPKQIFLGALGDAEWFQGSPSKIGLSTDQCNPILTNSNWLIMGVNHDIRDGAYYTTIKVMLQTPGVDLPPGSALGGVPGAFKFSP